MDESPISLCIADLDGNEELDIIIGTDVSYIVCITPTKEVIWELFFTPTGANVGYPCIMDLDNNERLEIIFTYQSNIYCYEVRGIPFSGMAPWYCLGGSIFHTGSPDSDSDYLDDVTEQYYWRTNPSENDTDIDGLSDGEEVLQYHTNPLNVDTDGDGFLDGEEIAIGTDPLTPDKDYALIRKIIIIISISVSALLMLSIGMILYIRFNFLPKNRLIQLVVFYNEDGKEKISLDKLLLKTSLQKQQVVKIVQNMISKKEQNLTLLTNHIYFLNNYDINNVLDSLEKEINEIIDIKKLEEEQYQRINQMVEELLSIADLAKELSDQRALIKCQMLLLTAKSYAKEFWL